MANDPQRIALATRQRELFQQADAALARGDKRTAERLEIQAAAIVHFYS